MSGLLNFIINENEQPSLNSNHCTQKDHHIYGVENEDPGLRQA
jgi:hypothetical protein